MPDGFIEVVDPADDDVRAIIARHHDYANEHSPPGNVFALDVSGLQAPSVTLFGFRGGGQLLGIGGLKELGDGEAEIKSMHTIAEGRGRGVGGALVDHIVAVAIQRGLTRLNLETGAQDAFAPAWSIYERRGFTPCGAFGDYRASPHSRYLTLAL